MIELITRVPAAPRQCFELSLSVDAHTASMRASGERAVGGVTAGVMGLGDVVTWRARHFGVPFTMTSRISAHDAPHRFVDEQVSGPFRRWHHEHRFDADGDGTVMTDVATFESPAWWVGRAVDRLVLTSYLTRLLTVRNEWLTAALASPGRV
ncbi:SRPBCC family protein [Isoptericola cucumis]|uniref:SRPBCC family protein n=1 Tax=Isoptericola cucumis TaxID=1776856 RepID=UPI00320B479C